MTQVLFATTNPGKVSEAKRIFSSTPIHLICLSDIDRNLIKQLQVNESGDTFKANAVIKAQAYGRAVDLLTIADDSGLIVDALNGRPGVHSKRFGPSAAARNQKILNLLNQIPDDQRTANFTCAVAIYDPKTYKTYTVSGITHGRITQQPKGENGFGYDPIFYSSALKKTFAQASRDEKNRVSHRGIALNKTKKIILELTANTSN